MSAVAVVVHCLPVGVGLGVGVGVGVGVRFSGKTEMSSPGRPG